MKKCRFHDPHYISQYYEGTLDEETEKAFAEHILKCSECMNALLDLEKDLFLMKELKHDKLPEKYVSGITIFLKVLICFLGFTITLRLEKLYYLYCLKLLKSTETAAIANKNKK